MLLILIASVSLAQTNKNFQKLLSEHDLVFNMPTDFEETPVKENGDLRYDYAIKYKKDTLEVRYSVFSIKPLLKQYKESLNNPNESLMDPNKYHNSMFMANILNVSQAGMQNMPETSSFPADAVKKEFGADYGATTFFKANSEFSEGYDFCLMLVIHKKDVADVYISFLGKNPEKLVKQMSLAFSSLKFKN